MYVCLSVLKGLSTVYVCILPLVGVGVYISSPFEKIDNNSLIQCQLGMICHYYCESGSLVDTNSQWYFTNTPVSTDTTGAVYQMSRNFAADGEGVVLIIDSYQSPNEGVYRCDINNVDNEAQLLFIDVFINPSKWYIIRTKHVEFIAILFCFAMDVCIFQQLSPFSLTNINQENFGIENFCLLKF